MSDAGRNSPIEKLSEADFLDISSAPARSAAIVYGMAAQALGLAMLNDVAAQQQASIARQAAVTMACTGIMSLCFASDAGGSPDPSPSESEAAAAGGRPDLKEASPAEGEVAATDPTPPGSEAVSQREPSSLADLTEAINQMQTATLNSQVVRTSGSGKAYQLVAQSAALSIVDAGDLMRAAATLAVFIKAMALTRYAMTGEAKYAEAATVGEHMLTEAIVDYRSMCTAAAESAEQFPSG
jgi:hypothetical protein